MENHASQQRGRLRRRGGVLAVSGLAVLVGAGSHRAAVSVPATTRSFLIVQSDQGIYYGQFEQDCPSGFEKTVEEAYLATKSPAERERLLKPENAKEYAQGWKDEFITGPGGENVCNNPKSFMNDARHPRFNGVTSKVAYGMNLDGTADGRATPATCGHEKFSGPAGESGIDNQLYRAIGCTKMHRGVGPAAHAYIQPFVIEVRGLDDLRNDDRVDVGISSIEGPPLQGPDGRAMANQTLTLTRNPRWRTAVTARVVDGQLLTEPADVVYLREVLSTWGLFGQDYEYAFYNARFRLSLNADGTVTGLMASYRPIDNIFTTGRCCKGTASTANYDCASEHKTLALLADGHPDPETGACTRISSASNLKGIPVFAVQAPADLSSRK